MNIMKRNEYHENEFEKHSKIFKKLLSLSVDNKETVKTYYGENKEKMQEYAQNHYRNLSEDEKEKKKKTWTRLLFEYF